MAMVLVQRLAFTMTTVLFMVLATGFGAAALGKRFRVYSIVTLVMLVTCGAATSLDAPRISANLPTPWVGVWERVNIGVFIIWVIALALALLFAPQPKLRALVASRTFWSRAIRDRSPGRDRRVRLNRLVTGHPQRQIMTAWRELQMLPSIEVIDETAIEAVDVNLDVLRRHIEFHPVLAVRCRQPAMAAPPLLRIPERRVAPMARRLQALAASQSADV